MLEVKKHEVVLIVWAIWRLSNAVLAVKYKSSCKLFDLSPWTITEMPKFPPNEYIYLFALLSVGKT